MSDEIVADLDTMLPPSKTVPLYRGRKIEVKMIRLKNIKHVIAVCGPLMTQLRENTTEKITGARITEIALDNIEQLPAIVSACLGEADTFCDDMEPDEVFNLFMAVVEVNVDFFIQNLLPSALRVGALLAGRQRLPVAVTVKTSSTGATPSKH